MKKYVFSHEMKTRDYECDIQGVVNNARYLHYLEVTRIEFIETLGTTFSKLHDAGIDLMVTKAIVDYKASLRGGEIFLSCLNIKRDGPRFVYYQDIYRKSDMKLCVSAEIQSVSIVNGRPSRGEEMNAYLKDCYADD